MTDLVKRMICNFMIRFYEPEALATAILYFNVYMNYHLSLALRVSRFIQKNTTTENTEGTEIFFSVCSVASVVIVFLI